MYAVIDRQTGKTVGTYATAKAARARRDALDAKHGSCRFVVKLPQA
jgi:hypothetical protein